MAKSKLSIIDRFWQYVYPEPNSGCWLWTGGLHEQGYGQFSVNRVNVRAHRFSYEHFKGTIPDGLELDHLCRVTSCVNPDHLEAVTGRVNTLRGTGPTAKNAVKLVCDSGHPYTLKSTHIRAEGWRVCRICQAQGKAKRRALKRIQQVNNHG